MTRYDPDWVRTYYDAYGSREWTRWDQSPVERVKLEVHQHYLREYLRPADRVLEIGAGAGRFTEELARLVHRIVVADISPVQLQLNRENADRLGFAGAVETWVECDVCDLAPHFSAAEFDAVVCYGGPLSYVLERRDQALRELRRVARPGGAVLLSVMSLLGTAHHMLPNVLALPEDVNRAIIATGDLDPQQAGTQRCHLFRAAELRRALEGAGFAVEVLSASDCLTATWVEPLAPIAADPAKWQYLVALELEACREPGAVDMGTHLIAVCRA